jgi:hypothetical protein
LVKGINRSNVKNACFLNAIINTFKSSFDKQNENNRISFIMSIENLSELLNESDNDFGVSIERTAPQGDSRVPGFRRVQAPVPDDPRVAEGAARDVEGAAPRDREGGVAPVRVHGRVSGPDVTAEAVFACEVYNSGTTIACTEYWVERPLRLLLIFYSPTCNAGKLVDLDRNLHCWRC